MTQHKRYYEAYDERYKKMHSEGICWSGNEISEIVIETIEKYGVFKTSKILEIGCGEGRDAKKLLEDGYDVLASDISPEAIRYCQEMLLEYKDNFRVLDCVKDTLSEKFDFIYAIAVIHMLVLDKDRNSFYQFIHNHLSENGIALICTMGNGEVEMQSDINTAFDLQERNYNGKTVLVAGTSCRMVNNETFDKELTQNDLEIIERGQTSIPGHFPELMYAVVERKQIFEN